MLAHLPLPDTKTLQLGPNLAVRPNVALLVYAGYQIYYFLLEPVGAVSLYSHILAFVGPGLTFSSHSFLLAH